MTRAQTAGALSAPAPLLRAVAAPSAGESISILTAAQRAQDLGLPMMAADLFRQAREKPGADRTGLTLALATALLDAGQAEEAEKVLAEMPEPRGSAWHLRAGLAAMQLRKFDAGRAEFAAIKESEVPESDYPWYWFFQGTLADVAPVREMSRANSFYVRAENAAATELARVRFQLAGEQHRLRMGTATDADLKPLRETYARLQGTSVGYGYAESIAALLDRLGRKGEAVTFLQSALVPLQRQEREWWDKLRLDLGLIGDKSRTGAGRYALNQLVENGNDPKRQRQALEILAVASGTEAERKALHDLLSKLIAAKPDHPIKESLLLYRAQLALAEKDLKDFALAEADANALIDQFPGSPLRVHALGVLTQSAWEQRRFRTAAVQAQKARAEFVPGGTAASGDPAKVARARADLGVLEAEARFRAGLAAPERNDDFRLAADAYAAVLRERPAGMEPAKVGALIYQRVLAEIKSSSGEAGKVLDQLAQDPAFDAANRWQAEWSLARALQLQGEAGVKEAFARVNNLLREPAPSAVVLPVELRARMAWLQARLAFEGNEAEQAIKLVNALVSAPWEIDPGLKTEIASTAILLKARAEFALGREPAAIETLKGLRETPAYAKTDAAISSFLIEAEHYAGQDKIDEARNLLIGLTDNSDYKNSEYVPIALFQLALLSERLGRPDNLIEANKRIEDLIERVTKSPVPGQADLVFAARMKQGDIFRKRNDFPSAQHAYEDLVIKYSRRPDVVLARLALAETHNALSSPADPSHADTAQKIFEQLHDQADAPDDVRVEAGYNLGKLLERRGKLTEAGKIWWQDVIEIFLKKPFEPGAKRPYWLARTLRDLGELAEKQGRFDEAKRAYQLILERRLPYAEAVARSRLEQLGVPVAKVAP